MQERQEGASAEVRMLSSTGIVDRDTGPLQGFSGEWRMATRVAQEDRDLIERDGGLQRAARDFDEFESFAGRRDESDTGVGGALRGSVAGEGKTLDGLEGR